VQHGVPQTQSGIQRTPFTSISSPSAADNILLCVSCTHRLHMGAQLGASVTSLQRLLWRASTQMEADVSKELHWILHWR
jgi:hypothetical protein